MQPLFYPVARNDLPRAGLMISADWFAAAKSKGTMRACYKRLDNAIAMDPV